MIGFGKHPPGLVPLFFTELWERFSFYGLNAILVLYLVLPVGQGGLGYTTMRAATLYGNYVLAVYLLSIMGGYLADRFIGANWAVLLGGVIIAGGHFSMALGSDTSLFIGLAGVAGGTGLLKPNISVLVGRLYAADDTRRDAGFSLFYMGINLGALASPIVCGYLAQGEAFQAWLADMHFEPRHSWHWGFGAAGIGMLIGVATFMRYWFTQRDMPEFARRQAHPEATSYPPLSSAEGLRRLAVIGFFCLGAILFSIAIKQSGASLSLFADRLTRNEIFGWSFPSSWFQSVAPAMVMVLAPCFSLLWLRMGKRQPSSPVKVVLGLIAVTLSFVVLIFAAQAAVAGRVSPWWLLSIYFVTTLGELCISPVGLSNVTRLAPPALVGIMMGLWFLAIGLGGKVAGVFAAWMDLDAVHELAGVFTQQTLIIAGCCALLAMLAPWARRVVRQSGLE